MSTPQALATIDGVRVRVTSNDLEGPADLFLLELDFDRPSELLDDAVYLSAFGDVVVSAADQCVVHIGREHRFGPEAGSTSEVVVTLAPQPDVEQAGLVHSVTAAFRHIIDAAGAGAPVPLGHDDALRTAMTRVVDLLPEADAAGLSLSTEEHLDDEWVVRLVEPNLSGFEVRIGFVDGHPGSTHIRRAHAEEVADSVGTG